MSTYLGRVETKFQVSLLPKFALSFRKSLAPLSFYCSVAALKFINWIVPFLEQMSLSNFVLIFKCLGEFQLMVYIDHVIL